VPALDSLLDLTTLDAQHGDGRGGHWAEYKEGVGVALDAE
jgi:hypothetical protein